ncbi:MAG: bifunctional demethylmenaquinone methyltransferase/2-methoxy-6-polyprenyl-1,4-benzoquinol methylase UbiE [Chitinophagaceae bacterium]|nr:bifunctional demethylmenaquinone methyltransferase/2-methoxy-6-polyprenyl-1,4-benzoquinol methylase UbiE [Chitinophagaceae bacterium]
MNVFPHDKVKPFSEEGEKKRQVGEMFDRIAKRYDFMNRFLSAGIDVYWRKKAIRQLQQNDPRIILDVATGTADMAIIACKLLNPVKVIGIDIAEKMLDIGRQKVEKENLAQKIELQYGDSETINFPDNTFDAVTVAFGVRNFEDLRKGLQEILRVLRPGGRLVIVECTQPENRLTRKLYNLYVGFVAPELAKWFNQSKRAYKYLNDSIRAFPDRQEFVEILNNVGYSNTSFKTLSLGICCIYCGRKL